MSSAFGAGLPASGERATIRPPYDGTISALYDGTSAGNPLRAVAVRGTLAPRPALRRDGARAARDPGGLRARADRRARPSRDTHRGAGYPVRPVAHRPLSDRQSAH